MKSLELSRETIDMQFCSDYLKTEIAKLFDKIDALHERLKAAEEALAFTLHSAEYLHPPSPPLEKGLDPTFYHTLTYEGDLKLIEQTKKAREALAKLRGEK